MACTTETWLIPERGEDSPLGDVPSWVYGLAPAKTPGQVGRQWSVLAFRGLALQVSGCEILFLKLDSWDQLGLLLLYQPPCCMATFLPELLEAISGLAVEFPRLMALGDFKLPSLGLALEAA